MKRFVKFAFVTAVIFSFAAAASAATFINIGTGSTGGTYYPVGAAMAKVWNSSIPGMKANAQSTGGTAQNLTLLAKGDAEVGFADGLYYFAYEGKGQFDGKPMKNIRGLVPLYAEPIHFLVAKGSGIKSLKDLKGKRVSVGAVGSGTEVTVRTLLKVNGIDPDKDIKAENLGLSDTATAFADKNIDAGLTVGALGIAGVVEITTIGTAELIDFEPDAIKNLCKELPYYLPFDIPANTYKGQTKPVKAMASWNILVVKDDLDKDLAYNMTKALFEKKKDILNVSTRLASMAPENLKYIQVPLHPGAEKYYKEIGAVK
ncbi:TAXI family TRAP transporter solute-binding subunit [Synergistes jonesii]|uniref:C4-dicarboxylate ABC transporter substrate-binding protein n=1 Tax=Synergistes jonesii TaxID=2754 RepID=A0A073ITJ0_9BACT|nr:TAXI family TRAP transporter solute-binding subunit [Synergistes jonesii]KEJ93074.1 C4-dicarboxylate ABC transporter substrate-binding protein [Synergistes jonesii]MDY2984247.1 TAXI family TRAP transporter solute-binding subunit [Synergistes jonesii]OFB60800.1 C4-dicarboxylate ABC transporter substrate-binding protein [Synergistes jonesii]OFB64703.1 C4-dicarboxylate ABC transporter substrate-binding protein [Synergistes jonesii]OFB66004.1 C4-dicarboxylate ABC transporter substrate-binding p